jgi:hypothetical protein
VFLGAEKPPTGLIRIEWDNTLGWIDKNGDSSSGAWLRTLVPTFSGSVLRHCPAGLPLFSRQGTNTTVADNRIAAST